MNGKVSIACKKSHGQSWIRLKDLIDPSIYACASNRVGACMNSESWFIICATAQHVIFTITTIVLARLVLILQSARLRDSSADKWDSLCDSEMQRAWVRPIKPNLQFWPVSFGRPFPPCGTLLVFAENRVHSGQWASLAGCKVFLVSLLQAQSFTARFSNQELITKDNVRMIH